MKKFTWSLEPWSMFFHASFSQGLGWRHKKEVLLSPADRLCWIPSTVCSHYQARGTRFSDQLLRLDLLTVFMHIRWFSHVLITSHIHFSLIPLYIHSLQITNLLFFILFLHADHWADKAMRRRTTGTGRTRFLKTVARRFKNGFREGTTASKKVKA